MKGAIFIALNDMIEQQHGIQVWKALVQTVNPPSQGIYTATEDYHEREMADLIIATSRQINVPINDVQRTFGAFLFNELNRKHPVFTQMNNTFFRFLMSINEDAHKEINKLYDEPSLSHIECKQKTHDTLQMLYRSPRKMCYLAEGLIQGAANHYQQDIQIAHKTCMHFGADHCLLDITILEDTQDK